MNDCRFGVSPINYPDPDPDLCDRTGIVITVACEPGCDVGLFLYDLFDLMCGG